MANRSAECEVSRTVLGGRLRWSNGLKNVRAGRYYVTQLLQRTVGSSAEKILYTVAPSHYANVVSTTKLAGLRLTPMVAC